MKTNPVLYRCAVVLTLVLAGLAPLVLGGELEKDTLFQAMGDELARSVSKLKLQELESPFYLEYTVQDCEWLSIDASFGALLKSDRDRTRFLSVDLRVGDYTFDNTNYIGGGMRDLAPRVVNLVTEDSYDALRREIWLATDEAYKRALEMLSRKRAYVKGRTIEERPDDLSREEPFTYEEPGAHLTINQEDWEGRVKVVSAILKRYPQISASKAQFRAITRDQYFLNNEGSRYRKADQLLSLEVTASTQAKDGMKLSDFVTFYSRSLDAFPSASQIARQVEELAESLTRLAEAAPAEPYIGPVLFQGQASAEFFKQLLAKNLSNPRTPLFEQEDLAASFEGSKLRGKLNRKILPGFMNAVDDPTKRSWNGTPLIGHYPVDDDGVPAQPVKVVERGKLVNFLMSRIPTEKISRSNGHGRGALEGPVVGNAGNLILTSEEGVELEQLKERLISACKELDLEYGILVTKMYSEAFEPEAPPQWVPGEPRPELSQPILVYKVWVKDGTEELMRGAQFAGATVGAMKDITGTSLDYYVYNFLNRDRPGRSGVPTSLIAPSIVVEELELKRASEELPKPPILPRPRFGLEL